MKGSIFILWLTVVSCTAKVSITEDEIKPDIFFAEGSFNPFTGKCKVASHDSKVMLHEFSYKKGILDGMAFSWHKNGKLKSRGSYRNGMLSGQWEFWNDKGQKTLEVYFENDELNGLYTSLEADGKIKEKGIYKNNCRTGKWICNVTEDIIKSGSLSQQ